MRVTGRGACWLDEDPTRFRRHRRRLTDFPRGWHSISRRYLLSADSWLRCAFPRDRTETVDGSGASAAAIVAHSGHLQMTGYSQPFRGGWTARHPGRLSISARCSWITRPIDLQRRRHPSRTGALCPGAERGINANGSIRESGRKIVQTIASYDSFSTPGILPNLRLRHTATSAALHRTADPEHSARDYAGNRSSRSARPRPGQGHTAARRSPSRSPAILTCRSTHRMYIYFDADAIPRGRRPSAG